MQYFFNVKYFYLDLNPLKSKSKPPPELDHPRFTKDLDPITLQHLDNRQYICKHNIIYSPIYYILHTLLEFGPQCRGVGGQRGGGARGGWAAILCQSCPVVQPVKNIIEFLENLQPVY